MTCDVNNTVHESGLEQLLVEDSSGFKSALEILLNEAMSNED